MLSVSVASLLCNEQKRDNKVLQSCSDTQFNWQVYFLPGDKTCQCSGCNILSPDYHMCDNLRMLVWMPQTDKRKEVRMAGCIWNTLTLQLWSAFFFLRKCKSAYGEHKTQLRSISVYRLYLSRIMVKGVLAAPMRFRSSYDERQVRYSVELGKYILIRGYDPVISSR